jgi:alkylhydroperoxidase family enzyme
MAWIETIDEGEATGDLEEVYAKIMEQQGTDRLANILKLHSLNPRALSLGADFMWYLMRGDSRLTFAQREMIATVTSAVNHCRY